MLHFFTLAASALAFASPNAPLSAATSELLAFQQTDSRLLPKSLTDLDPISLDLYPVGNATVELNEVMGMSEFILNYNITQRNVTVQVFAADCHTTVDSNVVRTSPMITPHGDAHANLAISFHLVQATLMQSIIWFDNPLKNGTSSVDMCVRVGLLPDDTLEDQVKFHQQSVVLTIDHEKGFEITDIALFHVEDAREQPQVHFDNELQACLCNATYDCIDSVLELGDVFLICVKTQDKDIKIVRFMDVILTHEAFHFTLIMNGEEGDMTTYKIDSSRTEAYIRQKLIWETFGGAAPHNVTALGWAKLVYYTGGNIEDGDSEWFRINIQLAASPSPRWYSRPKGWFDAIGTAAIVGAVVTCLQFVKDHPAAVWGCCVFLFGCCCCCCRGVRRDLYDADEISALAQCNGHHDFEGVRQDSVMKGYTDVTGPLVDPATGEIELVQLEGVPLGARIKAVSCMELHARESGSVAFTPGQRKRLGNDCWSMSRKAINRKDKRGARAQQHASVLNINMREHPKRFYKKPVDLVFQSVFEYGVEVVKDPSLVPESPLTDAALEIYIYLGGKDDIERIEKLNKIGGKTILAKEIDRLKSVYGPDKFEFEARCKKCKDAYVVSCRC